MNRWAISGRPSPGLAAAEKFIHACGYHRRDAELANAKKALLGG